MSKSRVMVALRDAENPESLVKLACHLAKDTEADVIALHVVELAPTSPLDVKAEALERAGKQVLSRALKLASETSSKRIFTRLARARRAGKAIVEDARQHGVELLVMGYHQPHRASEVLLGSTVRYVARHVPRRVIVQIAP